MATQRAIEISKLMGPVVENLPSQLQEISGDPALYVQPATVNAQLFGGKPVITVGNVNTVQAVRVEFPGQ